MSLLRTVIKRPVAVLMCVMSVLVLGLVSLINMPVELMPDMDLPMVAVVTSYPGAGPQEVEDLVTSKIENAVGTTAGLKTIQSQSSEGMSMVYLELEFGTDMSNTLIDMREKVDRVKSMLPDEADAPMVMQLRLDEMPIVMLSVATNDTNTDLLYLVNEGIKPEFESVAGVASVEAAGGTSKEIRVELDNNMLVKYNLSASSIASAISGADVNIPAGSIKYDDRKLFLRGQFDFTSIKQIEELPLTLPAGGVIKVADVAKVYEANKEITSISRLNGKDNITLNITKQQDANTVTVSRDILAKMEKLKAANPDLEFAMVMDQGDMITDSIVSVIEALLSGAALAVLVLWLFLGNIKASAIIAVSIPFSLIMTFVAMFFTGIDVNVISLGGLVVGVGMMVDNSIVVLESIFKCREQNMEFKEAAFEGARVVTGAIIASTLTTVVVFLPIVFMEGFTAEIFGQAGMTISFSLLASLISAITIVPCVYAQIKPEEKKDTHFGRFFTRVENVYAKIVDAALRHRIRVAIVAIVCMVAGVALLPTIGGELMPSMDQGQYTVNIKMEKGKGLEAADEKLKYVEGLIAQLEDVDHYSASIAGSASIMGGSAGQTSINVYMKEDRKVSTKESAEKLRELTAGITDCEVKVNVADSMVSMGGGGDQIALNITGTDVDQLETTTADLEKMMATVKGVYKTESSVSIGQPEARIEVDSLKAAAYNMTPAYVISSVSTTINGKKASTMRSDGSEKDIYIRYPKGTYDDFKKLEAINITSPTGATIPLVSVAKIVYDDGPVAIERMDSQYFYSLTAWFRDNDVQSIMTEFNQKLTTYAMPYGINAKFGGNAEMQTEAFGDLGIALIVAALLVFMVMAAQFESMKFSVVVMISVPFSLSGALFSLFLTGIKISMPALIGMIVLVGIVVNNAIVLIDWVNQLREKGLSAHDALVEAGKSRLRPIFMTTLTTVLGLLPLSLGIGQGGQMMQPMAVVTMGGLTISTLLTLIVVPVFYLMFENRTEKKKAKKQKRLEKKLAKINAATNI